MFYSFALKLIFLGDGFICRLISKTQITPRLRCQTESRYAQTEMNAPGGVVRSKLHGLEKNERNVLVLFYSFAVHLMFLHFVLSRTCVVIRGAPRPKDGCGAATEADMGPPAPPPPPRIECCVLLTAGCFGCWNRWPGRTALTKLACPSLGFLFLCLTASFIFLTSAWYLVLSLIAPSFASRSHSPGASPSPLLLSASYQVSEAQCATQR